jgi:HK97 gp10 family phage protein
MANKLIWHGDEFLYRFKLLLLARIDKAARHLVNRVKEKLSLTGVGQAIVGHFRREIVGSAKSGRPLYFADVWYKKRQRIYGFVRSLPGEPPRKQRGQLRMSIAHELDRDSFVARVGSNLLYAKFLELGTRYMKPRPFLRVTAFEEANAITAIMNGEMNFGKSEVAT